MCSMKKSIVRPSGALVTTSSASRTSSSPFNVLPNTSSLCCIMSLPNSSQYNQTECVTPTLRLYYFTKSFHQGCPWPQDSTSPLHDQGQYDVPAVLGEVENKATRLYETYLTLITYPVFSLSQNLLKDDTN